MKLFKNALILALALALAPTTACGKGDNKAPTAANADAPTTAKAPEGPGQPAKPDPAAKDASVQSDDILARTEVATATKVKHILFGWKELAPAYRGQMDPRAKDRTKAQADALALDILAKLKAGGDIDKLMAEHSEDPGSAKTGRPYDVSADARLVPPFKNLGLRLKVGETGVVETNYGWHVIKRIE